ncbi:pentatricopeptide repeat-containing protein At2g36730 [Impatiens glandulifera]|uniref:pentatricopeptide repeat-containing protein At2g36730 n=1 Tax=Impatiens glandulifera TaxID=253017 RepID=UPI001FB10F22|nr:pentatricopeptide repeat-containing protein At2g36730 [Impatiens glandulifera]
MVGSPKTFNRILNFVSIKLQCLSLLKRCSSMKQLLQIHSQLQINGFHEDDDVINKIVTFCSLEPSGSLNYAQLLIQNTNTSLIFPWNTLIRGHATRGSSRQALTAFSVMRAITSIRPDELTYSFLFKACASLSVSTEGKMIHVDVLKYGLDSELYVQNNLINFYGQCQLIMDARKVFDSMTYRSIVSWNSIISVCVDNSCFRESIELSCKMQRCGFEPNETTAVVLLSASGELGNLSFGKWIHSQVITKQLDMNCQLGTSLVDMYSKCGDLHYAEQVFDTMPITTVWTWSALIMGLAQHGRGNEALRVFDKMKDERVRPNGITFLGVLCACSHAGLVEEGIRYFHEMENFHGIKPSMMHHGAMVDVFCRAGRVREAYDFVRKKMHVIRPDAVVWRTLLQACNVHDVNDSSGIGKKVKKRLLKLEPRRGGNFVMMANKWAEVGMWEKAKRIRNRMSEKGLEKMSGTSLIEINGSAHRFFSGNNGQVSHLGICILLDSLEIHMKSDAVLG